MSTNAYVLNAHGKGRYVHWDGMPSGLGREIWALVKRDGLTKVHETLLSRNWSSVFAGQPTKAAIQAATSDYEADYGDAAHWAYRLERGHISLDVLEDGYGQFYLNDPDECDDVTRLYGNPEYMYYLNPNYLKVVKGGRLSARKSLGIFDWSGDEPDWGKVALLPS